MTLKRSCYALISWSKTTVFGALDVTRYTFEASHTNRLLDRDHLNVDVFLSRVILCCRLNSKWICLLGRQLHLYLLLEVRLLQKQSLYSMGYTWVVLYCLLL